MEAGEGRAPADRDEAHAIAALRAALTPAQRAALGHSRATALAARDASLARLRTVLAQANLPHDAAAVDALLTSVRRRGRVTVHFHPDRLAIDGRCVAEALRDDGVYRSQFETKISNGGLTAHPGGDRCAP